MDARLTRFGPAIGLVVAVVAGVSVAGLLAGGWWAPFAAGLAIGLLARHARMAIPLGAAVGLLSWGLPLVVDQARYGAGPAASAISAILGFGHAGAYSVVLTLLVGLLLGLTGAWLASAARSVVAAYALVDGKGNR